MEKAAKQQDKLSRQRNELLEQLIRRLSVGLQGYDASLDKQLEQLLTALPETRLRPLKQAARQLDKALRLSQDSRNKTAEQILLAVRKWISELKSLTRLDLTRNSLEVIYNRSQEAAHHYYALPSVLSGIVRLQSEILNSLLEADTGPDTRFPLDNGSEDTESALRHIATELLDLIDGLQLCGPHHQEARQLIRRLEQGFAFKALPELMKRVFKLVTHSNRTASKEFGQYLIDISEQLASMQHVLVLNQEEQQEAGRDQLLMSERMQSEVVAVRSAAEHSENLSQLKHVVATQLVRFQSSVSQLKQNEVKRQQEAELRHDNLTAQLKSVEEEARQTMIRVEEERLRSRTDPLTRLPNRTAYNERITHELTRLAQFQRPLSVAVCDIDHFKSVNDTYGHLAGDKALRLMASALTDALRNSDFVARYGGEEFIIIMPATRCQEATRVLNNIRKAVADSPFNFKGTPVPITVSIGVTEALDTDSSEELFSRADNLLYQAKETGRNRLCSDQAEPEHSAE